ncbi:MAG: TIGR00725 family protein [Candidatus Omnitrophota bacterium]
MKRQKLLIGVIGGHKCNKKAAKIAQELGKEIAKLGAILVCGGLGGIMKAAARGAKQNGGVTVGILPSEDKKDANKFIDIPIATGLGYTRNTLVATASDIIVALEGEYGTLSEIGFALVMKKNIINLSNWDIPGTIKIDTVTEAIRQIKKLTK